MDLVSIVVCTYNGAAFLAQQLDSLLEQTYPNLEILVSDDCSTDDTVVIAKAYAQKDSRVIVKRNVTNLGYNRNFENAFRSAQGRFIAVSDQDDIWKPDKIEKMLPLFTGDDVLLVYAQSVRFTGEVPRIERYTARRLFEGSDVRQVMYFNTVAGHNMIFRRELLHHLDSFPEDVFYDWWLLIGAALYGQVSGSDEVLTFHRYHTQNLTLGKKDEKKQTRAKADERLRTLKEILKLPQLKTEHRSFGEKLKEALSTLQEKTFSLPLFIFLLQEASIVLFFKKGSFISRAKMAYRMSFAI